MRASTAVPEPYDVGLILAMSLIEGVPPETITDERERQLVTDAGVSDSVYVKERFVLRCAAASHAVNTHLRYPIREHVLAGFLSWFSKNAAASTQFTEIYESYRRRAPVYHEAAAKDVANASDDPDKLVFSEIDYAFQFHLQQHPSASISRSACQVLAMTLARAYWQGQMEGSVALFQRAALLQ